MSHNYYIVIISDFICVMKKLISSRWFQYAIPFVIWFLLLVLPFLTSTDNNIPENIRRRFTIDIITANLLLLLIFYIHTYFIYPLLNKRLGWYILSVVVLLIAYWFVRNELHHLFRFSHHDFDKTFPKKEMHKPQFGGGGGPNFIPIFSALIALLCSFCYRMVLDNRIRQQLLKERETVHLKSELTFLRSQISPHFIFNVLNNLVSLARKKSDDLEPAIVNLSQFMRYMLYESDDNRVRLSKEIEYLNSYINLQKLRFGSNVKVTMDISGNPDIYTIEPMLLIPFVENAFKHGTGMVEDPVISITLVIEEASRLIQFKVVNKVSPLDVSKDNNSGIGISNVRRRLAILYPGKHELHTINEDDIFTADLSIHLSN